MVFKKSVLAVGVVCSALMFSACTKNENKTIIEKQPPANMLESFSVAKACQSASCVTIQKSSLGKIFLLIASGITSGSTPQWYDLKPLVVSFDKAGKKIALLGENYNSIYDEIKTVNLIQSFDVVSEDETSITFDWGRGLESIIVQSSYDIDTPMGNTDLTESSFSSVPVSDSFIKKITFDENNIEIVQLSKIKSALITKGSEEGTLSQESREESVNMNIQIRPYKLSSEFIKKEADRSRRVGFFVTKVAKKGYSKELTNLITKWDISPEKGPILVRISEAVPENYLSAVVEGAKYWNHVFGREVIAVETGVSVAAGPQDRSIMIRWIPWLDSGAAYAIGQSDPLTGELLRAQIFMPSVFTKVGSADLVKLNGDRPVVAAGAVACDLSESLQALNKMAREANDSQRLRLAQDSVRSTVAHELGHTLGLRHNFAGSYSTQVTTSQIFSAAKTYLQDLKHKGLETSTSIMDYVSGIDNILMSAHLKYSSLSYDKMAMAWAYSENDDALDENISLYCSDEDIGLANSQKLSIYGCERFDSGNNPLQRNVLSAIDERDGLISVLFTSIVGRMFPGDQPDVVKDLDQVLADTRKWMKLDVSSLEFVGKVIFDTTQNSVPAASFASLYSMKNGGVLLSKFGMDAFFKEERARNLDAVGGYAGVLIGMLRDRHGKLNLHWAQEQYEALKNSTYFTKGKSLSGRDYSFTEAEQAKLLAFFAEVVGENQKTLFDGVEALLPKLNEFAQVEGGSKARLTSVLGDDMLSEQGAEGLQMLYLDLLTAVNGKKLIAVGEGLQTMIEVPEYSLTPEYKIMFAKVLSSKGLNFNLELRLALIRGAQKASIQALLTQVEPSLNIETEAAPDKLARSLFEKGLLDESGMKWLDDEIKIMLALKAIQ